MKALMNSSGSMGPRKYPCMFLRNCSLRVLAGRAAFALYWLEPLGVSLVGVEWNCLVAMVRRVNDEKRAAPHSQIYKGSSDPPKDTWGSEARTADKFTESRSPRD